MAGIGILCLASLVLILKKWKEDRDVSMLVLALLMGASVAVIVAIDVFTTMYVRPRYYFMLYPLISAGYVARILAPERVGTVTDAQNLVSYFVMFAALGIPGYGTREIARHRNNEDGRNTIFSELMLINALATTVCLAANITK